MARMKWMVRMVLVAGAIGASGCATTDKGFTQDKVRAWAMQGEHMRQLRRAVSEPWAAEVQAPAPTEVSPRMLGLY